MKSKSGLVGIDEAFYDKYSVLDDLAKLKFELILARNAGISGFNSDKHHERIRKIEIMIKKEERKQKCIKLKKI